MGGIFFAQFKCQQDFRNRLKDIAAKYDLGGGDKGDNVLVNVLQVGNG